MFQLKGPLIIAIMLKILRNLLNKYQMPTWLQGDFLWFVAVFFIVSLNSFNVLCSPLFQHHAGFNETPQLSAPILLRCHLTLDLFLQIIIKSCQSMMKEDS